MFGDHLQAQSPWRKEDQYLVFFQYIKYKSGIQPMHSSRNGAHKITRSPGFPCLCLFKPPNGATLLYFLRPWAYPEVKEDKQHGSSPLIPTESGSAPALNGGSHTSCWDSLPSFLEQKPALSTSVRAILRVCLHLL